MEDHESLDLTVDVCVRQSSIASEFPSFRLIWESQIEERTDKLDALKDLEKIQAATSQKGCSAIFLVKCTF